jgi:hypothetical protein
VLARFPHGRDAAPTLFDFSIDCLSLERLWANWLACARKEKGAAGNGLPRLVMG